MLILLLIALLRGLEVLPLNDGATWKPEGSPDFCQRYTAGFL